MADNINKKFISETLFVIASILVICLFILTSEHNNLKTRQELLPDISIHGKTMGTTYTISFRSPKFDTSIVKNEIDSILKVINNSMSTYISNSEISTFNQLAKDKPMEISTHFYNVLNSASHYHKLSNKKFDPTIELLYDLWGFKGSRFIDEPSKEDIDSVMHFVGMDKIILNDKLGHSNSKYLISKIENNVSLDLSAIAKGYAVDIISKFLSSKGFDTHFVEIGGEIRTLSNSLPWSIGIQNPFLIGNSIEQIHILNKSVATSGNYVNYIEYLNTGSIKTHIIDPLTGYPLDVENGLISSATVISDNCIDADALATTLMLLDVDEAIDLIDNLDDSEAFIIYLKDSTLQTRETLGFNEFRD